MNEVTWPDPGAFAQFAVLSWRMSKLRDRGRRTVVSRSDGGSGKPTQIPADESQSFVLRRNCAVQLGVADAVEQLFELRTGRQAQRDQIIAGDERRRIDCLGRRRAKVGITEIDVGRAGACRPRRGALE